jgi:hypothetical protein
MTLKWVIASFCASAVLITCASPSILTPPTGPGTDYPCGVNWYVCAKGGGCCMESDVCGGDQGPNQPVVCPEGMCCNEGLDVAGTMSARRSYPQHRLWP